MRGILVVDKPEGWTSFDVIAKLRGVLGTRKLGHSGTLDPMATGVLPVFCGGASKAVDLQSNHDKTYEALIHLGIRTDTGDRTGTVLETNPAVVTEEAFLEALPAFEGEIEQIPPMYSAVKVNGLPLYKAARQGLEIERKPRKIRIYSIDYLGTEGENLFRVRIKCSKGTYIRTLAEDIAASLGQVGCLDALRRTEAGVFTVQSAHTLEEIIEAAKQGRAEDLFVPLDRVFDDLPALTANAGVLRHLENGCPTSGYAKPDGIYRTYDENGAFVGLSKCSGNVLTVHKLFR